MANEYKLFHQTEKINSKSGKIDNLFKRIIEKRKLSQTLASNNEKLLQNVDSEQEADD